MALTIITDLKDGRYLWAGHIQSIAQAIRGKYVENGCNVTAGTGLTVNYDDGQIYYNGVYYSVSAGSLTLASNSSGYPRADLIVWDGSDQTVKIIQGSEYWYDGTNYYPIAPDVDDTYVLLALIVIDDGATEITSNDIYDLRVSSGYSTNRLVQLAIDDTQISATGTGETVIKTFRIAKKSGILNLRNLYIIASLWVNGGFGRLRIYIDGTLKIELGTGNTTETVLGDSVDISDIDDGLHDVEIRLTNDGSYTTYNSYILALGDV